MCCSSWMSLLDFQDTLEGSVDLCQISIEHIRKLCLETDFQPLFVPIAPPVSFSWSLSKASKYYSNMCHSIEYVRMKIQHLSGRTDRLIEIARSIDSLGRSIPRSLVRSPDRSLARSLARSLDRSIDPSVARLLWVSNLFKFRLMSVELDQFWACECRT